MNEMVSHKTLIGHIFVKERHGKKTSVKLLEVKKNKVLIQQQVDGVFAESPDGKSYPNSSFISISEFGKFYKWKEPRVK